jgi:hypothetical protein
MGGFSPVEAEISSSELEDCCWKSRPKDAAKVGAK